MTGPQGRNAPSCAAQPSIIASFRVQAEQAQTAISIKCRRLVTLANAPERRRGPRNPLRQWNIVFVETAACRTALILATRETRVEWRAAISRRGIW